MFSSNQIIKVSGELDKEDVLNALTFAINYLIRKLKTLDMMVLI